MPTVVAADRGGLAGFALADGPDAGHSIAVHQDGGKRRHVIVQANGLEKALEIIGRLFVCHRAVQMPEESEKQHAGDKPPPRRQTAYGGGRRKCTVNSHSIARIRAGYIFFQLPLFSKACAAWMTLASS